MLGDFAFEAFALGLLALDFFLQLFPYVGSDCALPALLHEFLVCRCGFANRRTTASLEKLLGFRRKRIDYALNRGPAQTGRKERGPEFALAAQQLGGSFAKLGASEAEHGAEIRCVHASEKWDERRVGKRFSGFVEKGVFVPFSSLEIQPQPSSIFDLSDEPQVLVIMQKIVRGLPVNAEQQVANGAEERAFPGFVLAVEYVQIVSRFRKR